MTALAQRHRHRCLSLKGTPTVTGCGDLASTRAGSSPAISPVFGYDARERDLAVLAVAGPAEVVAPTAALMPRIATGRAIVVSSWSFNRCCRARDLAKRTGLSPRFFQRLAAERKITWVRKPAHLSTWIFDLDGFEEWLSGRPPTASPNTPRRASRKRHVAKSDTELRRHLEALLNGD